MICDNLCLRQFDENTNVFIVLKSFVKKHEQMDKQSKW